MCCLLKLNNSELFTHKKEGRIRENWFLVFNWEITHIYIGIPILYFKMIQSVFLVKK